MGAKIIAVANQKGGVGKTTTALSLAAALARLGERVLILDLDPHICASIHLRVYPEEQTHTIHELFTAEPAAWPALWPNLILHQEEQYWDVVSGDVRLSEIEGDVRERPNKGFILRDALKSVPSGYDYIMLDCPPQMGVLLVNALVASDLLVIPIQTDFLALHGLKLLFDTLRTLNKALPAPILYRTLPTMYDKRAKACTRVLNLLRSKMGDAMFSSIIPLDTHFREASALGRVVYDIDPACRGAVAYETLAKEVVAIW